MHVVENAARYSFNVARQTTNTDSITDVGTLVKKGGLFLALIIGIIDTPRIMPPTINT